MNIIFLEICTGFICFALFFLLMAGSFALISLSNYYDELKATEQAYREEMKSDRKCSRCKVVVGGCRNEL